jgi:hypothetical protein
MKDEQRQHLEDTLARLGIEEIEERMEVSPLLLGDDLQALTRDPDGDWICCSCKMDPNPPIPDEPPIDLPPGKPL